MSTICFLIWTCLILSHCFLLPLFFLRTQMTSTLQLNCVLFSFPTCYLTFQFYRSGIFLIYFDGLIISSFGFFFYDDFNGYLLNESFDSGNLLDDLNFPYDFNFLNNFNRDLFDDRNLDKCSLFFLGKIEPIKSWSSFWKRSVTCTILDLFNGVFLPP